jgi:hypothetical protein
MAGDLGCRHSFGLGLMYGFLIEQSKETGERQYPLARPADVRQLPPQPRLQQFPHNELYEFRLTEESCCTSTAG